MRRSSIEVADVSTYLQLIQARLGVALSPKSLLPTNHGLEIRSVTPAITWRVVLALPSDRSTRAAARAFATLVLDPQTTATSADNRGRARRPIRQQTLGTGRIDLVPFHKPARVRGPV